MTSGRRAAIQRLLADLRRSGTRTEALRRVRRRAGRVVSGTDARPASARPPKRATSVLDHQAMTWDAEAILARAIARGEPLERAAARAVDALTGIAEWHNAWALSEGLARIPSGAGASAIGHAVIHHRRRQFHRVWPVIRDLDDDLLAEFIPVESVDAALALGSSEGRTRALAIAVPRDSMATSVLVDLAGRMVMVGERARAADLIDAVRQRPSTELDARRHDVVTLIQWLDREPMAVPDGAIPIAIMDQRTLDPDLLPSDVDDDIQTLAVLGELARMSSVAFSGADGLGALATELQDRVRPAMRRPNPEGSVHLVAVDRDISQAGAVPPGTWMFAVGWHMQRPFDLPTGFPYHADLRPVFLSFHVGELEMLTDEGLAYLRRYGPVGCRDWTTVFLLLGAGVDAFFTGCVSTTIDTLHPPQEPVKERDVVAVIDLPRQAAGRGTARVELVSHEPASPLPALAERLRAADTRLGTYRAELGRAITARLGAYLPLTSLGIPVDFRPRRSGDERLAGLTGLRPGDPELVTMRDGIRTLIEGITDVLLSSPTDADVEAEWRRMVDPLVAEARRRFEAPIVETPPAMDVGAVVEAVRASARRYGPHDTLVGGAVTDIALCFDQNVTAPAAVLVESLVAHATGPIRLWVLGRGLPDAYGAWLADAFPALPMTILRCDAIGYGPTGRPRRVTSRITVSTMDRLILPELLHDVDRVVYLDVDTLVVDDIGRLAAMDLAGRALAARDSNVSEAGEMVRASRGLTGELSIELRRRIARRHGLGREALNAGVLVLDLERLRAADFTATCVGLVERYGFHDQDTLLTFFGPDRAVIAPTWNAMPVIEDVHDPSLIHWASFGKPWDAPLTYERDRWQAYATRLAERAGDVPSAEAIAPPPA